MVVLLNIQLFDFFLAPYCLTTTMKNNAFGLLLYLMIQIKKNSYIYPGEYNHQFNACLLKIQLFVKQFQLISPYLVELFSDILLIHPKNNYF